MMDEVQRKTLLQGAEPSLTLTLSQKLDVYAAEAKGHTFSKSLL